MERKVNINPSHLRFLGLQENVQVVIGVDASDCPDCIHKKTNAGGEKVCKAVVIYISEPTSQLKTKPKN